MNQINLLNIIDLGNGKIQISLLQGTSTPRRTPHPISFEDPFQIEDRNNLRWYLEDYLQTPYEDWRARQVEEMMASWGELLFNRVFIRNSTNPDPYTLYHEAVREGLEKCQLCISSEDPDFLNIPWELIRDPTPGRGYLAPSLGGLFRFRTGQKIEVQYEFHPEEPFRILLVIARPYGKRDIPIGTIARPLLEALRPFMPKIQLDILRPPTFDALVNSLNSKKGYYQLVHFDGHGEFLSIPSEPISRYGTLSKHGHLVFEKEDGAEHIVNSQEIGQALATCKVPLFVLNACQSAEEGRSNPFSSVASQLVAIGAKGVLAMSFSVYASSAKKFMQRFYEQLAESSSLSEAVAAGRLRLFTEPPRDSLFGQIELKDWIIPTLYQQNYSYIPIPESIKVTSEVHTIDLLFLREICPEGRFGFIGRDYEILQIERAFYEDERPWVLLTGIGGIGKTELVFGFARWYAETGGCNGGVFPISFKEKADFGQIYRSVFKDNPEFIRLSDDDQWLELIKYLKNNNCLLVWDNFETVEGYPKGSSPLATDDDRKKISKFLKSLRGSKSRVLITSRKREEKWTGVNYKLIELPGLNENDAGLLAKNILDNIGYSVKEYIRDSDYLNLIRLLRGHPRSLEIVLPNLKRKTPSEIIDSLQHRVESFGEPIEDATLEYAFLQMSKKTIKHLPLLGLFTTQINLPTLIQFVGSKNEHQKKYKKIMGESLNHRKWSGVLREASENGLLKSIKDTIYEIHPTLSPFLRRQLLRGIGKQGIRDLDTEYLKFYTKNAEFLRDGTINADSATILLITLEEGNFLRALRLAMTEKEWESSIIICQVLDAYYNILERKSEWRAIRLNLLIQIGYDIPRNSNWERGRIWRYLLGSEAQDALERNQLEFSEKATKQILNYLISLNDPRADGDIAVSYHTLGMIEQERGKLKSANNYYHKARVINEMIGMDYHRAANYHQLGICAQKRYQYDDAEIWLNKAIEIKKQYKLEPHLADSYHHLGMIYKEKGDLDKAESYYHKAKRIREKLNLVRNLAKVYIELNKIEIEKKQYKRAIEYIRKALSIYINLRDVRGEADCYSNFGIIDRDKGNYEESEQWYFKALSIYEKTDNIEGQGSIYNNLGILYTHKKNFRDAKKCFEKGLNIVKSLPYPFPTAIINVNYSYLYIKYEDYKPAIYRLGHAYEISKEHNMPLEITILEVIKYIISKIGKNKFIEIWEDFFKNSKSIINKI